MSFPVVCLPSSRTTIPTRIDHWQGCPLTIHVHESARLPIAGAASLVAELRLSNVDTTPSPLARVTLEDPTGDGPWALDFTDGEMNQSLGGKASKSFWLPVYTLDGDGVLSMVEAVELVLHAHAAAASAPLPPTPTTALTQTAADLLYEAIHPVPVSLQDNTLPLYIIPVMRQYATSGAEALGLWYSRDGITFSDLYAGDLFTGTVDDNVRDPSLVIRKNGWYVAYTAGTFGQCTYFGIAKSVDQGKTWVHHTDVEVPTSIGATWGPSFFPDPATGNLYVFISISTGGGNHKAHVMRCLSDDLLTWDAPVALTGDAGAEVYNIDIRAQYANGYYYQIASVGTKAPGSPASSGPAIYRSKAVAGPWMLISSPYSQWHSGSNLTLEQTFISHRGADRWQANFTKVSGTSAGGVWTSFSNDNLLTWSAPVQVLPYSGSAHSFSEYVYIPPSDGLGDSVLPRLLSVISAAAAPTAADIPAGGAVIWENTLTGNLTFSVNQNGSLRNHRLGNRLFTVTAPAGVGVNLTTNLDISPAAMGYPFAVGVTKSYEIVITSALPVLFYQKFLVRCNLASGGISFDAAEHASLSLINAEVTDYWDVALSISGGTGPLRVAITNKVKDGYQAFPITVQIFMADP